MSNKYGNLLRNTVIVLLIVLSIGLVGDIGEPLANGHALGATILNALTIVAVIFIPLAALCLVPIFILWRKEKSRYRETDVRVQKK